LLTVALAALALVWPASTALGQARPLRVEDVVGLGMFGRAAVSPDGGWIVYEKRGAYDDAPRFDRGPRSGWPLTDLWVVDLRLEDSRPVRLLPEEPPGLLRVSWSPQGGRLLVYRYVDDHLEAGVVAFPDSKVTWLRLTPDMPLMGSAFQWVSEDKLVLMTRPDGSLPWLLRYYGQGQARMIEQWRRASAGREPSRTVIDAADGVVSADGGAPDQALVLLDFDAGTARTLKKGRLVDLSVSPNGDNLAVTEEAEPIAVSPESIDQAEPPSRLRLSLIDLHSGSIASADETIDVAPHLLRWSADSQGLLIWGRRAGSTWKEGDLLVVRPDGTSRVTPRHGLSPLAQTADITTLQGIRADWMGDTPILYARAGDARFDWYALRNAAAPIALTQGLTTPPSRLAAVSDDAVYGFADGAFWRLGAGGGERVSPGSETLTEMVISDPERSFRLANNDPPRDGWAVAGLTDNGPVVMGADADSLALQGLPDEDGMRSLAVWAGGALMLKRDGLQETLTLKTEAGTRTLDVVNAELSEAVLPTVTPISHLDPAGRPAQSWLFLPYGVAPSALKGLVVQIYPGSVESGVWTGPMTLTYGLRAQVLAGEGYAVLSAAIPRDHANSPAMLNAAVDEAVNAALAAHPELPESRMALIGHSFGAQAALWIATRSDRFRSYIAWAATTDMFGQWGEFTPAARAVPQDGFMFRNQQGWAEGGQGQLGAPPWIVRDRYANASSYLAADQIAAPVLLITSDRDFVAMSQSERMFSALYRLGRRTRLVTYWGEEHMLWSPANIRDLYGQVSIWLDETLASPPRRVSLPSTDRSIPGASPRTPPPG